MSHLFSFESVKFLIPSCLECRWLLRDIGDCVYTKKTYDLLLGLYQLHWARSHEIEAEVPLYLFTYYRCGEPGAQKH